MKVGDSGGEVILSNFALVQKFGLIIIICSVFFVCGLCHYNEKFATSQYIYMVAAGCCDAPYHSQNYA